MIILSHESALEYWRTHYKFTSTSESYVQVGKAPAGLPGQHYLQAICPELARPLHLLVSSKNIRAATYERQAHRSAVRFPEGSFVRVHDDALVSSPELCFLQLADTLPLINLIMLGFELCGGYRLSAKQGQPAAQPGDPSPVQGFVNADPLTTVDRLAAFVAQMDGAFGRKKAARALSYVLEQSASPMETALAMLLCLPCKLGGYGLPRPIMNQRIDVSLSARRAASKQYYVCDLFWPDAQLAVEYDSNTYHALPQRISEDAKKRNALAFMGIEVLGVTSGQIHSQLETDRLAQLLSKRTGKRIRPGDTQFAAKQKQLRAHVLI